MAALVAGVAAFVAAATTAPPSPAPMPAPAGAAPAAGEADVDWPAYGGAPGGGQHSALAQIDRRNVQALRQAWSFRTGELGDGFARAGKLTFEANPIVVAGRLLVSTAAGTVFALDPGSGRPLWRHDPQVDRSRRYSELTSRGVASRLDAAAPPGAPCRHTVYVATIDARLIALDGADGTRCAAFGNGGQVDLRDGVAMRDPGDYLVTSPPAVVGAVVVVGSAIGDNRAVEVEPGVVRGYDARTGRRLWTWDPVPRRADAAAAAGWAPAQAARVGAANAWAPLAVDEARGLVFVPTGSASPDFYGGERLGANADANSLVALRAASGEPAWRRQLVHHDLWDFDLPAQPVLAELTLDGRRRAAVIQATKMGFVFVLDRDSGAPLLPVDERAVPASDVPGERAWPTQPFPRDDALRLVRTDALTPDDAWGLTPIDRWLCRRRIAALRSEGVYTPPSVRGSLLLPGYAGGVGWGGVAFDPRRQVLYVPVMHLPMFVELRPKDAAGAPAPPLEPRDGVETAAMRGTPYALRRGPLLSPLGLPCTAPPWGTLAAVDLGTRRQLWQRPTGTTAGKAPVALELGLPSSGGAIVTDGGLVFMAGTTDSMLRAYDADTGAVRWQAKLPAAGHATPATYRHRGRQYVVVAAGGHGPLGSPRGDHVVAFALP